MSEAAAKGQHVEIGNLAHRLMRAEKLKAPQTRPTANLKSSMVTLLMFDHHYQGLWRCWMDYWQKSGTQQALEVDTYDSRAEAYVAEWHREHPEVAFRSQLIETKIEKLSKVLAGQLQSLVVDNQASQFDSIASEGSTWDSKVYEVHFWKRIKERLMTGKDVLHMDLDAIPVGDPWEPIARTLEAVQDADIVVSGQSCELCGIQYMFFRNTAATNEVVDYHIKEWDDYFASPAMAAEIFQTETQCPPADPRIHRPCEPQLAFGKYQEQNGCDTSQLSSTRTALCKTHTNRTLKIAIATGVASNLRCAPEECKKQQISVDHGRRFLKFYCPSHDVSGAQGDILPNERQ